MQSNAQIAIPSGMEETDSILLPDPTDQFSLSIPYQQRPERRLMAAVLENGVNQFKLNTHQKTRTQFNQFREAYTWIFTVNLSFIFSFDNCCYCLDLDPDYYRKQAKEYLNRIGYIDASDFYKRRKRHNSHQE